MTYSSSKDAKTQGRDPSNRTRRVLLQEVELVVLLEDTNGSMIVAVSCIRGAKERTQAYSSASPMCRRKRTSNPVQRTKPQVRRLVAARGPGLRAGRRRPSRHRVVRVVAW